MDGNSTLVYNEVSKHSRSVSRILCIQKVKKAGIWDSFSSGYPEKKRKLAKANL